MEAKVDTVNEEIMTLGEIANYLKVSEKTVTRMVQAGEMPAVKVSNQWRFLKPFVDDWLVTKMQTAPQDDLVKIIATGDELIPISRLISPKRIIVDLKSGTKEEILSQLAEPLVAQNILPNKEHLMNKLLEREAMVSTAIGHGIALPHVREPKELKDVRPAIALGISKDGIDFDSLDGDPTHVFALCVSPSEIIHLRLMAKISFLLRDNGIIDRLCAATRPGDVMTELIKADVDLAISL